MIYRECFLLYNDEQLENPGVAGNMYGIDEEFQTDIAIFSSFEKIQDALYMTRIDDITFPYPTVLHGIMTPATVIPVFKYSKELGIWIVKLDMVSASDRFGKLYTATLQSVLHGDLEDAVENTLTQLSDDEIESVYIFYGEDVQVFHAIDEEFCNDLILAECENIGTKAKALSQGA